MRLLFIAALTLAACQPGAAPDGPHADCRSQHEALAAAAEAVAAAREALAGDIDEADHEGAKEALDDAFDILWHAPSTVVAEAMP